MLLLVVDADLDQPRDLGLRLDAQGEQLDQPLVHVRAIGHDPLARGSRQHAAFGARLPRPLAFIVGVEAVVEGVVEGAVMRQVLGENECLKKPGDVCEVPFGGACVFHGLDGHVLGAERRRKLVRQAAHIEQPVFEHAAALDRRSLNGKLARHGHSSLSFGLNCPVRGATDNRSVKLTRCPTVQNAPSRFRFHTG